MSAKSLPDALRACIELGEKADSKENWRAARAAEEFIRQHGPALEALLREREWRPIESVPRDGRSVDMWRNDGVRVSDVHWLHEFGSWSAIRVGTHYTHWMPLPAGPNGAEGDVRPASLGDSP